jgi:hypothetical protein
MTQETFKTFELYIVPLLQLSTSQYIQFGTIFEDLSYRAQLPTWAVEHPCRLPLGRRKHLHRQIIGPQRLALSYRRFSASGRRCRQCCHSPAGRRIGTVEPNAARLQGVGPQHKSSVAAGDRLALRRDGERGNPAARQAQRLNSSALSLLDNVTCPRSQQMVVAAKPG